MLEQRLLGPAAILFLSTAASSPAATANIGPFLRKDNEGFAPAGRQQAQRLAYYIIFWKDHRNQSGASKYLPLCLLNAKQLNGWGGDFLSLTSLWT